MFSWIVYVHLSISIHATKKYQTAWYHQAFIPGITTSPKYSMLVGEDTRVSLTFTHRNTMKFIEIETSICIKISLNEIPINTREHHLKIQ